MPKRDRTGIPAYGQLHKKARKRFALRMKMGEVFYCWRPTCPTPDVPIDPRFFDLGHVEGEEEVARYGRRWPEHPRCNRATMTHALALARGNPDPEVSHSVRRSGPKAPRFGGLPDPDPTNEVSVWSRHWSGPFNPRCPECRRLGRACPDADPD